MTTVITVTDSLYSYAINGGGQTTQLFSFSVLNTRNKWVIIRKANKQEYYYGIGSYVQRNYAFTRNGETVNYYDQSIQIFRKLNVSPGGVWSLSNQRYIPSVANATIRGSNITGSGAALVTMIALDTRAGDYLIKRNNQILSARTNASNIYNINLSYENRGPSTPRIPANLGREELLAIAQAARERELRNTSGRSGSTSSGTSSSRRRPPAVAPPARFTPRPQPAPITVDFGPGLQFGPSPSELANKPYLMQRFVITGPDGNPQQVTRRFLLKIIPNSFQYSNVNAAWNEVDRPGNFAITDWAKYNLLKVSFKFVIAADVASDRLRPDSPSDIPLDGLLASIEPELREIRAIASAPHPVTLVNFQQYLTNTMRFPFIEDKSGAKFVIADMSVTTSRFLPNGITEASAAEVSMTLTEFVEPVTQLAKLPPIQSQQKPPSTPTNRPPSANNRGLYSDSWTIPIPGSG